jgi:UDP-N-acetylglucosamine diphosphorylase/glucosamine-1-phosphate N-acetyltransferase
MRPAALLRCGIQTIAEKWMSRLGLASMQQSVSPHYGFHCRKELQALYAPPQEPSDSIWINGRWIPDDEAVNKVKQLAVGEMLVVDDIILAARPSIDSMSRWISDMTQFQDGFDLQQCGDGLLINQSADLFLINEAQILADAKHLDEAVIDLSDYLGVHATDTHRIYVGKNVTIEPGVVLIPDGGIIHIGDDVVIQAGSRIRGSVSIARGSTVRMGASIYGGTTIGPFCKVGGEIQQTVMFGYANKAHGGYLGNSVVAEWVNIGADANTSNLKNNYTTIRLEDWNTGDVVDTGLQFFGSIFGDHTKIAIGSKLNSGSQFGVSSSFLSNDFSPKRVPHFGWITDSEYQVFEVERAIQTAKAMMQRRNVEMNPDYENLMRQLAQK